MPWKPFELITYWTTFLVTPVDLCIIFQCNLYVSCMMSCGNKIVSIVTIRGPTWCDNPHHYFIVAQILTESIDY